MKLDLKKGEIFFLVEIENAVGEGCLFCPWMGGINDRGVVSVFVFEEVVLKCASSREDLSIDNGEIKFFTLATLHLGGEFFC